MSDGESKTRVRKKNVKSEPEDTDIYLIDENVTKLLLNEIEKKKMEIHDETGENKSSSSLQELECRYYQYISESQKILSEYKNLCKKAGKKSFMKQQSKENPEVIAEKDTLYNKFIDLVAKFGYTKISDKESSGKCSRVGCNSTEFNIIDSFTICLECGLQTENISHQTNFSDGERINMNKKYKYGMRIHFRDTLNQFQGKQNKYIEPEVYKDLEKTFEIYGLVNKEGKTRQEKYAKVTREYIKAFLHETEHKKYYEDVVMLHEYYTGIPPINLTDIESDLMADFDEVEKVYKELPDLQKKRLNFLNNQYILYQFLKRRGVKCSEDDFSILKTVDKKLEHDEIYEQICRKLMWKFTPIL